MVTARFAQADSNDPTSAWVWSEAYLASDPNDPNAPDAYNLADPSFVYGVPEQQVSLFALFGGGRSLLSTCQSCETQCGYLDYFTDAQGQDDKPYAVAGELLQAGSAASTEIYWIARATAASPTFEYRKSVDGGLTWFGDFIFRGDPNADDIVEGVDFAQPVAGRGTRDLTDPNAISKLVVIAYTTRNDDYFRFTGLPTDCAGADVRFLTGRDIVDPNDANHVVEFSQCIDAVDPSASVVVSVKCGSFAPFFPHRAGTVFPAYFGKADRFVPQLAYVPASGSTPDTIYYVQHDVHVEAGVPTADLDVFCWVIERVSGDQWRIADRVRVNQDADDPNNTDRDQFLPNVVSDKNGRVHVTYYDDRAYVQPDGPAADPNDPNLSPRFDFYYAVSPDRGQHWFERRLAWPNDPSEPAVDLRYSVDPNAAPDWVGFGYELTDYTGIAIADITCPPQADDVWMAFTGTSSTDVDPNNDKSVIWYSRVLYTPDIDRDGAVGLADLGILIGKWNSGNCDPNDPNYADYDPNYDVFVDLTGGYCVDLADLGILLSAWGDLGCVPVGGVDSFRPEEFNPPAESSAMTASLWLEACQPPEGGAPQRNANPNHHAFDVLVQTGDADEWTAAGLHVQPLNGAAIVVDDAPTACRVDATCLHVPGQPAREFGGPAIRVPGTFVGGARAPVWRSDAIDICWTVDGYERIPAEAAAPLTQVVLDLSAVQGLPEDAAPHAVYFSDLGPENPADIPVALLTAATTTRTGGGALSQLSGTFYAAAR